MSERVGDRKQLGVRVRKEVVDALDRVNETQEVGSRSETLEWLILRGMRFLEDWEHVREREARQLCRDAVPGSTLSVRLVENEKNTRGRLIYSTGVYIDGKDSDFLRSEAFETDSGGIEVTIALPGNDNAPALVFERLTAAEASEIRKGSEWTTEGHLTYLLCRPLSDFRELPIWDAPGERLPKTRASVEA